MRFDELPEKLQRAIEEGGVKMSSVLTAAELLTWNSAEQIKEGKEENMILEFARQYEKLNDEEKSEFLKTAKSAHEEYVQEMMKRVREPVKPRIRMELSHKDLQGEVEEDQIQDAMEVVECLNKKIEGEGKKMKLETVNLSFVSATPYEGNYLQIS
jgi:hypothetical protein